MDVIVLGRAFTPTKTFEQILPIALGVKGAHDA